MGFGNVVSQLYANQSTVIGAAPKTKEKPRDTYAKMVGDVAIMRYVFKPNEAVSVTRYIVKLPFEERTRTIDIIEGSYDDGTIIFKMRYPSNISAVAENDSSGGEITFYLKKSGNKYTAINEPGKIQLHKNLFDYHGEKDKEAIAAILKPARDSEDNVNYKEILNTILAGCSVKK